MGVTTFAWIWRAELCDAENKVSQGSTHFGHLICGCSMEAKQLSHYAHMRIM
jgi:hypothetical protein